MKQTFTLVLFFFAVMQSTKTSAQYSQNFDAETDSSLTSKCWQLSNTGLMQGAAGDKYLQMTLSGTGPVSFVTPYIQPNSTNLTISFAYKIVNNLGNNSYRTITLSNGSTIIGTYSLTRNSPKTGTVTFSTTLSSLSDWPSFTFKMEGAGDESNVKVQFDDLSVTGLNNITNCSIPKESFVILPVKLLSFNGKIANNKALLSWDVADNEDGKHFVVEESSDNKSFKEAAMIMSTNKTGTEAYQFADASFNGKTFYRLKVVNSNAGVTYSKTILLQEEGAAKASNLSIRQNPVTSSVNFDYAATATGTGLINLYNYAGEKVFTRQMTMNKGSNATFINLDGRIAPGMYILEVVNGTDRSTARLIKK